MPKVKINVKLYNKEEKRVWNVVGIIQEKILKYKEDDTTVTFDYEKHILKRDNKELKMVYDFKENQGTFTIKENNQIIEIPIETKKIKRNVNDIIIEYQIEDEIFIYQVEEEKWVY